jgi:hypothetical protein
MLSEFVISRDKVGYDKTKLFFLSTRLAVVSTADNPAEWFELQHV